MDWIETGNSALSSLGANKLRSALMLTGIIIGVAAVIIVLAVGLAGQKRIEKELETFGNNSVWIWRDWDDRRIAKENFWASNNEISNADVTAIKELCPNVIDFAPALLVILKASYKNDLVNSRVLGTTQSYQNINNEKLIFGRFLTEFDEIYAHKVCILSSAAKMHLFKNIANPLGGNVILNNEKFSVVGVLGKKDRGFLETIRAVSGSDDNDIYIPLSVMQNWYETKNINLLQGQALPGEALNVARNMKEILISRHHKNIIFSTESMEQYIKVSNRIMGTLSLVLGVIAGISLFVGGLGIMNVMLISVTERTREIGLRKAIGATQKEIICQFLIESILISLIGGFIGIILAMLGVWITSIVTNVNDLFSLTPVLIAFLASVIIGILAGLYPAIRAAELDPIEALGYE